MEGVAMPDTHAFITDDAVVLGLLAATLGVVFWTANSTRPVWRTFYKYVPALLLCYFIPALYNTFGLIDGEHSRLYFVSSRYLLPATLVLLTLAIDLPAIMRLGPKALALFLTGTVGVVIGGPVALGIVGAVSPETVGGDTWRGLTAVAGSWIGGGANQAAMKEVFAIPNDLFGTMVAVGWRRTSGGSTPPVMPTPRPLTTCANVSNVSSAPTHASLRSPT
jgi:uncharacterized membrane protein